MAENTETVYTETTEILNDLAGKYLSFLMADEEYGLEILKVQEIIGIMDITTVPRTPEYIRGVINLRGKIIPVVDLRVKFGMDSTKDTELTCIIVVDVVKDDTDMQMGILVDTVSEVLDIESENIEPAPSFGNDVNANFILGVGKFEEKVIILLDIDKVLTGEELKMATEINNASENGDENK